MPITVLILLPCSIFIFIMGFWVWLENRKSLQNILFLLLSIVFGILFFCSFVMNKSCSNANTVLFWDRFQYIFSVFSGILMYHFSLVFSGIKGQRKILYSGYILTFIFSILSQTDYFVKGVFNYQWGCHTIAQIGHHIWLLVGFMPFIFLFFVNIIQTLQKSKEAIKRTQAKYIIVAFSCQILMAVAFLPAYKIEVYPFGYIGPLLFITIIAYAITEKQLFAPVIATDILVLAILIFLATFLIFPSLRMGFSGRLVIFLLILFLSYLLVKYTHQEAKRRAEAERLAAKERTLRKRAESVAQEFQRLDKAKTQFILTTQHHLRTPLSIIKGYVSMILEGSYNQVPEEFKKPLLGIEESTDKAIKIVNELLDISQTQIKGIINKQKVNLLNFLNETIGELLPLAKEKGLYLTIKEPQTEIPEIEIDQSKMKAALCNLIDNGIKYTKKGGITIEPKLIDKDRIQIIIADTGIGLTQEEISHLFERPFERGKDAQKMWGSGKGIGLVLTKTIVEAHQGKVWAKSPGKNKGSTFYIELPIK